MTVDNEQLLMGDIQVNTINGIKFPNMATYHPTSISNTGIITIPIKNLFTTEITDFPAITVYLSGTTGVEPIYPDINWKDNKLHIDLGFSPKPNEKIYIAYNYK